MNDVTLFLFLIGLPCMGVFLLGMGGLVHAVQDAYWQMRDRRGVAAWMSRRPRH